MIISYEEYKIITGDDQREPLRVEAALEAASALAEAFCKRRFNRAVYTDKMYFEFGKNRILLQNYPIEGDIAIMCEDGAAQVVFVDENSGIVRLNRPIRGAISVEYTGGYAEIPGPIRQAVAVLALSMMDSSENGGRALMSERLGDYQVMFYNALDADRVSTVATINPAAARLLAPYRSLSAGGD